MFDVEVGEFETINRGAERDFLPRMERDSERELASARQRRRLYRGTPCRRSGPVARAQLSTT